MKKTKRKTLVPCPKCGELIAPAALLGSITSKAKSDAARENGAKSKALEKYRASKQVDRR